MNYLVRPATPADLDVLAGFEAAEARRRFGAAAMDDIDRQRHKLAKALRREPEAMLVAEIGGEVAGWVWLAVNTNALTGSRYVNCRALTARVPEVLDPLLEHAVGYARHHGVQEIVGQAGVDQDESLAAYRRQGFQLEHLTMRRAG